MTFGKAFMEMNMPKLLDEIGWAITDCSVANLEGPSRWMVTVARAWVGQGGRRRTTHEDLDELDQVQNLFGPDGLSKLWTMTLNRTTL